MKVFKSIKWRLQLWYGLLLVGVLAGFGLTAYQLARDQHFGRIDAELHKRVGILINALHHPPPRRPGEGPDDGPGNAFDQPSPDQDQAGQFPGPDRPSPRSERPPHVFHLPPEDTRYFDGSDPHDYFFQITRLNLHGRSFSGANELARSTNFPSSQEVSRHSFPEPANNVADPFPSNDLKPPGLVTRGYYRESGEMLPSGEFIVVGCSIKPEYDELRATAIRLTVFGGCILLLGLAGGWWLVDRALRPVAQISSAAARISGSDLTQRINVAETESELGQLANVLNSTFDRLENAFAQQRQFTADAAHELRTPVTVILTQTQTALNRERDASAYRQSLEACQRAAQRMRKLIESLLALARLDAGQETLNLRRLNLTEVALESVALLRPLAEEKQIKITTELTPVEINGDAVKLAQVLTNLIANAIQYNRPAGEIRVNLNLENNCAVLAVADTGPGIPLADQARVFERFFRADQSRTGSGNAGLGLAICQAIVTAHAGKIEVHSPESGGTIFKVSLPAEVSTSDEIFPKP